MYVCYFSSDVSPKLGDMRQVWIIQRAGLYVGGIIEVLLMSEELRLKRDYQLIVIRMETAVFK